MPDIDPNLIIDVSGTTGAIATEWVTSGGITNAHVQIVKLAWGPADSATRVQTSSPLPVTVISNSSTLGISGSVSSNGNLKVINGTTGSTTIPFVIQGTTAAGTTPVQISGNIQGITNGVNVGVTGTVTVGNTYFAMVGLSGGQPMAITGGRPLNYLRDTVTVYGTVGVSGGRYLLPATDGVKIYNAATNGATLSFMVHDGSGNPITSTGNALNVNLVGAGITATVNVGTIMGISQADQNVPLFIAGATAGPAVRIKGGLTGGIVEVGWSSALPVAIDPSSAVNLTFEDTNITTRLDNIDSFITNTMQPVIEVMKDDIDTIKSRLSENKTYTTNTSLVLPKTVYTGKVDLNAGITGSSGVQIFSGNSAPLKNGITIKSLAPSTGGDTYMIKITGNSSSSGVASTTSYFLSPGETIYLSVDNTNLLYFSPNGVSVSFCFIAS